MKKIIQIVPVNGVFAVYKDEESKAESKSRILVVALYNDGVVSFLDGDVFGELFRPEECSNFLRFDFVS